MAKTAKAGDKVMLTKRMKKAPLPVNKPKMVGQITKVMKTKK